MHRIEALEIDDHILDKIESEHGVTLAEVKEAFFSEARHVRREREGLYKLFSRTEAGRYLFVPFVNRGEGTAKIRTARDMTRSEYHLYQKAVQKGGHR